MIRTIFRVLALVLACMAFTGMVFGLAVMQTPTPGSTLSGSSVTFDWTAGTGASAYWLTVGSTAGGDDYYSSGNLGNVLTAIVNGLPTNGSTLYVTLYSLIGGAWVPNAYTYTALSGAEGGVITTPTPGSTLSGSSMTFGWTAGAGASAYWLVVGSTAGGDDYYSSGNLGNVLTAIVNGLPTNGSTLYVTLYSLIGGAWVPNAYTYTALSGAEGGVITTPTPGSTLSGSSMTFGPVAKDRAHARVRLECPPCRGRRAARHGRHRATPRLTGRARCAACRRQRGRRGGRRRLRARGRRSVLRKYRGRRLHVDPLARRARALHRFSRESAAARIARHVPGCARKCRSQSLA